MKLTSRQKARLKRPRLLLFLVALFALGLPWALLFRTGVQARRQAAQVDATANVLLSQISTQPQNQTAKRFDRLAAQLGFVPNSVDALSSVDTVAEQDYKKIEALLNEFLAAQMSKTSGSLAPVPAELNHYLAQHEAVLAAVQVQLLEKELPTWEVNIDRMTEASYALPGFTNVLNVQKLLMLLAVSHAQQNRTGQMLQAMEASWRLNEAIADRPDLVSQLLASSTVEQQSGLLRHIEVMPVVWQEMWQERLRVSPDVTTGLQFDAWLQYGTLERSLLLSRQYLPSNGWLQALSHWFSPTYYFSLRNIDTHTASVRAIETLRTFNICQTTRTDAERQISLEGTAVWNPNHLSAETLARRWKAAGDRALTLELTQKILLAKSLAQQSGQWPPELPHLASEICPGEYWIYKRIENAATPQQKDVITLSLSAPVDAQTTVPLSYTSPSLKPQIGF